MKKEYKIITIIGIFYLVYILLFLAKFDFNPSAAIIMSDEHIVAHHLNLPKDFVVYTERAFDGQHYYTIATDIFNQKTNMNSFRYQRIIYPLLVYLFSFGNQRIFPITMIIINYASILLGAYIFLKILRRYKANINLAYLWAFNIGYIVTITLNLAEPLLFLFILIAIYYLNKNAKISALFLTIAVLTKEIALLFIIPLAMYYAFKKKYKKSLLFCLPVVAYFVWQITLLLKFGPYAIFSGVKHFTIPLLGLIQFLLNVKLVVDFSTIETLSVLPVMLFVFIQIFLIKSKKMTPFLMILIFQIIFMLSFTQEKYNVAIYGLGRRAMGLFLFSILYTAENRKKYNILLVLLTISMSVMYIAALLILFQPNYFVT